MTSAARRVYLDHAATTPPDPAVVEAMRPWFEQGWHNPSSIYVEAQRARQALDESRAMVAAWLGASAGEIVFTSGGSESNSLALRGALGAGARADGTSSPPPSSTTRCSTAPSSSNARARS